MTRFVPTAMTDVEYFNATKIFRHFVEDAVSAVAGLSRPTGAISLVDCP